MRAYVENLNDWRSRLARLELQIALTERTGEVNWHLRIRARVLRYLLARYSEPLWEPSWHEEPSWPPESDALAPIPIARRRDLDARLARDEGDAAASLRAITGVRESADTLPELTWLEVCYCLLPWDQPCRPPGSAEFENPPRPPEVLADKLRNIHALNTAPRRRWFKWGW
jgi:hypothetical protein